MNYFSFILIQIPILRSLPLIMGRTKSIPCCLSSLLLASSSCNVQRQRPFLLSYTFVKKGLKFDTTHSESHGMLHNSYPPSPLQKCILDTAPSKRTGHHDLYLLSDVCDSHADMAVTCPVTGPQTFPDYSLYEDSKDDYVPLIVLNRPTLDVNPNTNLSDVVISRKTCPIIPLACVCSS